MPHSTISEVSTAYACASICKYTLLPVSHQPLRDFCHALDSLKSRMGDVVLDDYWQPYFGYLTMYRYAVTTTPLPINHPDIYVSGAADALRQSLSYCHSVYPKYAVDALALLDRYEMLSGMSDNPLMNAVMAACEDCDEHHRIALLLARGRHTAQIAAVLQDRVRLADEHSESRSGTATALAVQQYTGQHTPSSRFNVVTPVQLRTTTMYSRIVAVGIIYYFPEFVFAAPRAREVLVVQYDWIRSGWKHQPVFEGGLPRLHARKVLRPTTAPAQSAADVTDTTGADRAEVAWIAGVDGAEHGERKVEILDRLTTRMAADLTRGPLLPGVSNGAASKLVSGEQQETLPALLVLLEDGHGVFLEAGAGGKADVVDVESGVRPQVQTIPVADLETGMFVLLRTEGGGDYVVPVANDLLGERAAQLRSVQRHWKVRLREEVNRFGMQYAVSMLKKHGSQRASDVNVRNWMSTRNIRTQDYADFRAIMRFVSMSAQAESIWADMETIDLAHRDAGWRIRKMLEEQVAKADLRQLNAVGRMDFRLPEAAGGSLSLLRIEHVAGNAVRLPASKLGHMFDVPPHEFAMHLMAGGLRG